MRGATLDTTFIVDRVSYRLRDLWEAGIIIPKERLNGPYTQYYVEFVDRPRALEVNEDTYAYMIGQVIREGYIDQLLDEDELREVQKPHLPAKQEEKLTYWTGVDDVVPDPVSIYDLELEAEEVVEED